MIVALPEPPISCLVCKTPASPGDEFCGTCGALLPEPAITLTNQELDLEQLFSHEGRIGRSEYLATAVVLSLLLSVALGLLAAMSGNILGVVLGGVLVLATAFALTCASIKRLHDCNTTGWLAVIGLIPVIGWAFIVILALIGPSTVQNPYGVPNGGSIRS